MTFRNAVVLFVSLDLASNLCCSREAPENEKRKILREEILKNIRVAIDSSRGTSAAYRRLFEFVGKSDIPKLMDDNDTSIALQAAWENFRKPVRRSPTVLHRSDWVFDSETSGKFVAFLGKRVGVDPPDWWTKTLSKGDVFPGQHHGFFDIEGDFPSPAKVTIGRNDVTIGSAPNVFIISKSTFEKAASFPKGDRQTYALLGMEQSYYSRTSGRGYPFRIVCVETKSGKELWSSLVWAVSSWHFIWR